MYMYACIYVLVYVLSDLYNINFCMYAHTYVVCCTAAAVCNHCNANMLCNVVCMDMYTYVCWHVV
jgi:hypothetical protein